MRSKLNARTIAGAEPRTDPYEIRDSDIKGLMLRVQPSGVKSFYVEWSRGKRVAIGRFPGCTLATARAKALEVLNDAAKHGVPAAAHPKTKVPTFKAFIDDEYAPWVLAERKAGKATVANIRAQFSEFDSKPLTAITAWAIDKFKARRLHAGISPVTVNRDLDRIRAAINKAVEWNLLAANPLATVERPKVEDEPRVRWLRPDEEQRLRVALAARETERRRRRISGNAHAVARGREALPIWAIDQYTDHLAPLVLLAMNTGLRRGELLGLTWEAVDRKKGQIKVTAKTSKSARVRHVPLNSEAAAVIERLYVHSTKQGLLFPGGEGRSMTHVKRSWASLAASAELVDFHFHDLRHHFASKLMMSGADLYVVKELLGHSDSSMTERYAHLSQEHKAAAVQRLVAQ